MSDQRTHTPPPSAPRPGKFLVFNETDGILVHTGPITRSSAERLIRQFRARFRGQGFYLTARRERINPEEVQLSVVPANGEHVGELESNEREESRKRCLIG